MCTKTRQNESIGKIATLSKIFSPVCIPSQRCSVSKTHQVLRQENYESKVSLDYSVSKTKTGWIWWSMIVITEFRKLRQKDHSKFKSGLPRT